MAVLLAILGLFGLGGLISARIDAAIDAATPDEIDGTDTDDSLTGTSAPDLLRGFGGADTIAAGDGADALLGGVGDDLLRGEDGDDLLYGEDGNDVLRGGNGNDYLRGQVDNDKLSGNNGNDTLEGGRGDDTLDGNAGDDLLEGGDNADLMFGDIGNDTLRGETGDDTLLGEAGDDVLRGDAGKDLLQGGAGADLLDGFYDGSDDGRFGTPDSRDRDTLIGGDQDDRLILGSGDLAYGDADAAAPGAAEGGGADVFVTGRWVDPDAAPVVKDFEVGVDMIEVLIPSSYAGPGAVTLQPLAPQPDGTLGQQVLVDGQILALVESGAQALRLADVRLVRSDLVL